MQTEKDAEIVSWIGRTGAAGAEHVMGRFAMGQSWAYARLSRLVWDGLLEQKTLLYRKPGLYIATTEGLRSCGLERLGFYRISPGRFLHASELASQAVALHRGFSDWELLSERDIRAEESEHAELVASARRGDLPGGRSALHRPDLALISPEGRTLAVEVELSIKAPRRLAAICRGWARARHVSHIYYFATPAVARAVDRAIAETRAEDRITILPVRSTASLIDIERQARDVSALSKPPAPLSASEMNFEAVSRRVSRDRAGQPRSRPIIGA
jgi:hypothetical protein